MNFNAQVRVDLREFSRTMSKYLEHSNRDMAEALSTKAFFVAKHGLISTPKVSRAKIESDLGAIGRKERINSKGKLVKGAYILADRPLAYKIIQARLNYHGKPALTTKAGLTSARRLIAHRARTSGTLRAGWHGMLTTLGPAIKEKYRTSISKITEGMRKVKGKGEAERAKPGFFPAATLIYRMLYDRRKGVHPHVQRAMIQGIRHETAEMVKYISERMQKVADQYNSR